MTQIIPIKDLKNTSEISEKCHVAEEPIYFTKNGYGYYEHRNVRIYDEGINMYNKLALSETQIKKGDTKDARQSLENLRDKYVL